MAGLRPRARLRTAQAIAAVTVMVAGFVGAIGAAPPAGASAGQVVTPLSSGLTPAQLVDNFVGGGVTTSNVTYTGDNGPRARSRA